MSLIVLSAMVAVVMCDISPYAPPAYKEPARPYSYSYSVSDNYHGTEFGASESSDGAVVQVY